MSTIVKWTLCLLIAGREALRASVDAGGPAENGAKVCDQNSCLLIRKAEGLVVNGALFLPLRKMSESFGAKVAWDPRAKAVIITK